MSPCYWDSSALVALLLDEVGAARIHRAADEGGLPGYTSFFSFVEMESAFSRRIAEGVLTQDTLVNLRLKSRQIESTLTVIWPVQALLDDARRLVADTGLRAGDALQLASAKAALRTDSAILFASLDKRLNVAAQAVGLSLAW
jgi:predicted nucleic acid-binding protein